MTLSNPASEHASTPNSPIRHTVDTLNSDALDALYDEIDRLRADIAGCRAQRWPQRLGEAEKRLARVRKATANSFMAGPNAVDVVRVADVLAALAEPKED